MASKLSVVVYLVVKLIGDAPFVILAALYVMQNKSPGAIALCGIAALARTVALVLSSRRLREARKAFMMAQRNYEETKRHLETTEEGHRRAREAFEVANAEWEAAKSPRGFWLN